MLKGTQLGGLAVLGILGIFSICYGANTPATGNLAANFDFTQRNPDGKSPMGYVLTGNAEYRYLGDQSRDVSGWGVALQSNGSIDARGQTFGSLAQTVTGINAAAGRWFRFSFRGLPQDNFAVDLDDLYMKVDFLGEAGKTSYDAKEKKIYPQVQEDRKNFTVNGDRGQSGAAVWRTYELEFYLPFPQVDELRLSVGFDHAAAKRPLASEFFVTDFKLVRIDSAESGATATTLPDIHQKPEGNLIPIGGRWFYLAKAGETKPPASFDYTNADRLYYHDDAWTAVFDGSMTSWLRAGDKDTSGNIAKQDVFVPDNVTVRFDANSMIIHTRGLPNHPTGKFPETGFGGNPSYITEQNATYYIPLNPKENPKHIVTAIDNSNHALNMGPIGIAANGVVLFNPFDANSQDASSLMDRCCGHPNPQGVYHYHKYPICINSPWADEGNAASPLIGWAFDGFPIYGPYAKVGVMAKDVTGEGALNGFNASYDDERGWHYNVTPGKFPYIIGGYWGTPDARDVRGPGRMGGPGGGRGGPGGLGGFGGPGQGPPDGPGGPGGFPPDGPPPWGP